MSGETDRTDSDRMESHSGGERSVRERRTPSVSVVVPCLNEREHIEELLENLRDQTYPRSKIEILVVDGRSTDGTREVIRRFSDADHRIRLLDNPDRGKPEALNRGVRAASGEVFVRADAHAHYPKNYVELCVRHLVESDAQNVGGLRKTEPQRDTLLGRAIAAAISSPFGSGGATYRSGAGEQQYVDTVFGGCYWIDVFERIGHFDERLARGQDREFNERLRQSGGKILFVPEITCTYYARSRLGEYLRWVFECGVTPFYASRLSGTRSWSFRNLVPPAFLVGQAGLLAVAPVWSSAWPGLLAMLAVYIGFAFYYAVRAASRRESLELIPVLVPLFYVTHVVYGAGALYGFLRFVPDEGTRNQSARASN